MKFAVSLLAAASLVAAQSNPLNDIPKCAQDCVGKFLTGSSIAGCSQLDYKCVCSNEKFIDDIACCLAPVCDDKGKSDTIALANKLCKAFSVDLPTAVVCKTDASASSTAASTGSATSSSNVSKTTDAASSSAGSNGAAASTTSKPNAAPTNVAGIMGAAAALAFAL